MYRIVSVTFFYLQPSVDDNCFNTSFRLAQRIEPRPQHFYVLGFTVYISHACIYAYNCVRRIYIPLIQLFGGLEVVPRLEQGADQEGRHGQLRQLGLIKVLVDDVRCRRELQREQQQQPVQSTHYVLRYPKGKALHGWIVWEVQIRGVDVYIARTNQRFFNFQLQTTRFNGPQVHVTLIEITS